MTDFTNSKQAKKKSQGVFVKFENQCLKNRNYQSRSKYRGFLNTFFGKYTRFVRNFLTNLKFDFFFHFFTTDVLTRLVGGPKVASKIYRVVFEKKEKKKEVLTGPPTDRPTDPSI